MTPRTPAPAAPVGRADADASRGAIVFLNGVSSAGKTTLARSLQRTMAQPFLCCSSDHWAQGLDPRRTETGPFAYAQGVRPRFFRGFHAGLAALADAGNHLIVDSLIEQADWRSELRDLLHGHDVFLVGVHCALDELERRERARGDRRIGEAREHLLVDRVHALGAYDLDVDSTSQSADELARQIVLAWQARSGPSALFAAR